MTLHQQCVDKLVCDGLLLSEAEKVVAIAKQDEFLKSFLPLGTWGEEIDLSSLFIGSAIIHNIDVLAQAYLRREKPNHPAIKHNEE